MSSIRIKPEHCEAIARAILEDEASPNGEHLYDGERLIFYCPMQAPAMPPGDRTLPHVPVRDLLPVGLRPPTVGDYLARARPGSSLAELDAEEQRRVMRDYEADAVATLAARLPEAVEASSE